MDINCLCSIETPAQQYLYNQSPNRQVAPRSCGDVGRRRRATMSAAQMKIPMIKDLNTNNDRSNKSSGTCEAKHLSKGRPPKRIVHFFSTAGAQVVVTV